MALTACKVIPMAHHQLYSLQTNRTHPECWSAAVCFERVEQLVERRAVCGTGLEVRAALLDATRSDGVEYVIQRSRQACGCTLGAAHWSRGFGRLSFLHASLKLEGGLS